MTLDIPDQSVIINHYGVNNQLGIYMEECAELIQAISKLSRSANQSPKYPDFEAVTEHITQYFNAKDHVREEMADVIVCINQLQLILGIDDYELEQIVKQKINRQLKRMENENG